MHRKSFASLSIRCLPTLAISPQKIEERVLLLPRKEGFVCLIKVSFSPPPPPPTFLSLNCLGGSSRFVCICFSPHFFCSSTLSLRKNPDFHPNGCFPVETYSAPRLFFFTTFCFMSSLLLFPMASCSSLHLTGNKCFKISKGHGQWTQWR